MSRIALTKGQRAAIEKAKKESKHRITMELTAKQKQVMQKIDAEVEAEKQSIIKQGRKFASERKHRIKQVADQMVTGTPNTPITLDRESKKRLVPGTGMDHPTWKSPKLGCLCFCQSLGRGGLGRASTGSGGFGVHVRSRLDSLHSSSDLWVVRLVALTITNRDERLSPVGRVAADRVLLPGDGRDSAPLVDHGIHGNERPLPCIPLIPWLPRLPGIWRVNVRSINLLLR